MTRTPLHLNLLFVFLLTGLFQNAQPIRIIDGSEGTVSEFTRFSASVQNGEANTLRGVYVQNVLALPVVQQPADQPFYVSSRDGEVTQFAMVSGYGNVGLLAHNKLAGRHFSGLALGQEVLLIYGDGRAESFVVTQVLRFQALQPESVSSSFRNLDKDEVLSAGDMFNRVYVGERRVVFQTCIEAYGDPSWGRLFIVAVRKT